MPLYRVTKDGLTPVAQVDFASAKVKERQDLQRLLRDQIQVLDRDLYVICEEFGQWDAGSRRIDLLALDRDANLVVVELKRTEHGGYTELQAIRYAAMVANMTFEQAVATHREYLTARGFERDARQAMLEFLGWDEASEDDFGEYTRILLVSADFSKELTTSVLWLIEKGLDIRCIRLRPHKLNDELVLQVEQVLPLPEAQDYVVGVREKKRSEARTQERDLTRFNVEIDGQPISDLAKRQAILRVARHLCSRGATPAQLAELSGRSINSAWRGVDGALNAAQLGAQLDQLARDGGPAFDAGRWFLNDEFLIQSGGKTWVFTKMWGERTEDVMRAWIASYPNAGISVTRSVE
jgi:hypothetical protein